jgi:hypothetical protein
MAELIVSTGFRLDYQFFVVFVAVQVFFVDELVKFWQGLVHPEHWKLKFSLKFNFLKRKTNLAKMD